MSYWDGGGLLTLLCLAVVLGLAAAVRRLTGVMDRLAVPDCMLAGVFGLVLGPQVLGLLPVDQGFLEDLVYHGLAVLYLAVGLQTPERPAGGGGRDVGAVSVALAVPSNAVAQGVFGLLLVLAFSAVGDAVHPGMGMLFPLAWNQGPGQAMSLGRAWEQSGLQDGGQLGLILATTGLLFAVVTGAPLVAWGRRRGWVGQERGTARALATAPEAEAPPAEGALDPLSAHLVVVGVLYAVVYLALRGITGLLAGNPQAAATVWGFHFLLAVGVAVAVRAGLRKARGGRVSFSNNTLGRIAGVTVDWTTAAAISAVQLSVLRANWVFIGACVVLGGLFTLFICLWVGKRAFNREPFEHAVVLYGIATGTLTTGLALLRVMDPEMKGSTASNFVIGSTAAALGGLPLLALMSLPIAGWPDRFWPSVLGTLGLLVLYLGVLFVIWGRAGAFLWLRPLASVWPKEDWPKMDEPPAPSRSEA